MLRLASLFNSQILLLEICRPSITTRWICRFGYSLFCLLNLLLLVFSIIFRPLSKFFNHQNLNSLGDFSLWRLSSPTVVPRIFSLPIFTLKVPCTISTSWRVSAHKYVLSLHKKHTFIGLWARISDILPMLALMGFVARRSFTGVNGRT